MTRKRTTLFEEPPAKDTHRGLDLSQFQPKAEKPIPIEEAEKIGKAAEAEGFTTRHAPAKGGKVDGRTLKRSPRTTQFNVRLRPETAERFWQKAREKGFTYADDFLDHLMRDRET